MTRISGSIALVGFDENAANQLSKQFSEQANLGVEAVSSPLAAINGHAVRLSQTHDLVLFQTDAAAGTDTQALQTIREKVEDSAVIVALTDANASLAASHALSRAGADLVLPDTLSAEELQDVVLKSLKSRSKHVAETVSRRGRVITVAQSRGGVGATTVAVNLADALTDKHGFMNKTAHKRVVVVDFDLQFGAVAGFLDVERNDSLYQIARDGSVPDSTFLEHSIVRRPGGIDVLPAPISIAPMDALRPEQVRAVIETLTKSYDFVIVDLPRTLVGWISGVIELTDRMLMVTDTAVPSIQQARRLIDFYTEDNIGLKIDIVINHEKKPMVKGRHHTEAAKVLERSFEIWLPNDPVAARDALDRGVPISEAASRSALAKSIRRLGRNLSAELEQPAQLKKTNG